MNYLEDESMDQLQIKILKKIIEEGREVSPRGMPNKELTGFTFKLTNPRARIIYNPARNFNVRFAIGELLWYLSGSNKCEMITHYNKRYPNFSDDGEILNGAYGYRIFTPLENGSNQWEEVKGLLKRDKDTRQAILNIHMPKDLFSRSKDIPCTCYLQFLIRDNKLDCIGNMRSNDIIWGTPYDVFNFTMLQEIMANELGLELGTYTHFAGSVHLYDNHKDLAHSIINQGNFPSSEMPSMPENPWRYIKLLIDNEKLVRKDKNYKCKIDSSYWNDFLGILKIQSAIRENKQDIASNYYSNAPSFFKLVLPNLKKTVV
ncbi:thymidylate synthase [Lysinibacillus sp. NPDC097231]|uniref:thymidylate synthase n=1 Tax=Lysinibacillus sp. NPDC097231 TaxID=3364142 RepID=UPI003824BCF7